MNKLYWYFVADADCLFRGTTGDDLAKKLARLDRDALNRVLAGEDSKGVPSLVEIISIVGKSETREPEDVRWSPRDWPADWTLACRDLGDAADRLILSPGTITLPWPPKGGHALDASVPQHQPDRESEHTVRNAGAVLEVIDWLVTKDDGRKLLKEKMQADGSIRDVDALSVLKNVLTTPPDDFLNVHPSVKGGSVTLPDSFRFTIDVEASTRRTWIGVGETTGGVHVEAGWRREKAADALVFCPYPCGAITECD